MLLALVLAVAGVGVASIPDRDGGRARLLREDDGDPAGYRYGAPRLRRAVPIERAAPVWNRRGLRGLPGVDGTNGTNGANGLDGNERRGGCGGSHQRHDLIRNFTSDSSGNSSHESVACYPGERVVGGGIGWTQSPGSDDAVRYSGPEDASGNRFPAQGATPTG